MNSYLKLDWCSFQAAKFAVTRWHYSHSMPSGKLIKIGVWENEKFIGCVIFGRGGNNDLGTPYGLTQLQTCELVRIALTKHETPVSRIVAIAIKMLKKHCPGLKLIVSFADAGQNHHGGIYQAGNWIYNGHTPVPKEYYVYGKRTHARSVISKYGTVKKDFITPVNGNIKYRYLMPLDQQTKDKIIKLSKPYPTRSKQATGATSTKAGVQRSPERSSLNELKHG